MSDIVELLRGDCTASAMFEIAREAADEIDRLREALRPFANEAERMRNYPDDYPYSIPTTPITVGDLRRAYAALAKEAGQQKEEP